MATILKLKSDIKKLNAALKSKGLTETFKNKVKTQLEKAQNELESMQKGGKPRKVSTTKGTKSTLDALKSKIKSKKYGVYKGAGVDLKKDADRPAKPIGKRKSKNGNTYYEYRANRIDVKQPSKKATYPKLEKGGSLQERTKVEVGDEMISVIKNRKEKTGYPLYIVTEGYAPITLDVYESKEVANKKAKDLAQKEGYKLEKGGYMAKGGEMMSDDGDVAYNYIKKMQKIKVNELNKWMPGQKYVWYDKSSKKFYFKDHLGRIMEVKNGGTLGELDKFIKNNNIELEDGGYMAKGGEVGDFFYDSRKDKAFVVIFEDGAKMGIQYLGKDKKPIGEIEKISKNEFEYNVEKGSWGKWKQAYEEGGYMAKGGEITVYNLRKGDKVKTRKGDIETIIRKNSNGNYETIENEYTHSPESLEFVSRPSRKMAEGGETKNFDKGAFDELVNESVEHLWQGYNKLEQAMNYLSKTGQGGLINSFKQKVGLDKLEDAITSVDAASSKYAMGGELHRNEQ